VRQREGTGKTRHVAPISHIRDHTWVWLGELGSRAGRPLTLASVPDEEWGGLRPSASMPSGSWGSGSEGPEGQRISMENGGLLADFRRALPDFTDGDNVGSPYCVRRYVVDARLGGPKGWPARGRSSPAWACAYPRFRPQPCGPRSSLVIENRLLHRGKRGRSRGRPRVIRGREREGLRPRP
jgi:hypothetical protein